MKRVMKLRNPWGKSKWNGAFSEGSQEYSKLDAYFQSQGIKVEKEGGKFFIEFEEFRKNIDALDVAWGQESRTGGAEHAEWQPRLDLIPGAVQSVQIDLCEDINLKENMFGVQLWQGGNKIGTHN